jgi:hypothetical protein
LLPTFDVEQQAAARDQRDAEAAKGRRAFGAVLIS